MSLRNLANRLDHLAPEKNIICAIATALIAVLVAHWLEASGASISPDGSTCITATRPDGVIYLTVNQIIYLVSVLSVLPAYVWDCIEKYRAKKAKG